MTTLKAYTLGNSGYVGRDVIEAIGEPDHVQQADVTIVAASKRAAVEVATQVGMRVNPSSDGFRLADHSSTTRALEAAGLLDEPAVYAHAKAGGMKHPLVQIVGGRHPVWVGTLHRVGLEWEFVPASEEAL